MFLQSNVYHLRQADSRDQLNEGRIVLATRRVHRFNSALVTADNTVAFALY